MVDGERACSLSDVELRKRLSQWSEVTSLAVDRRVEGDRIVSVYPPAPALVQRLRDLIAAESECCSFMTFELEERSDEVVVDLRVPGESGEAIATMLGLGLSGSGPTRSSPIGA